MTTNDLGPADAGQAAKLLGIGRSIREHWGARSTGPYDPKHGRWLRYRPGDLRAFVESGLRRGAAETAEGNDRDGSMGCGGTGLAPAGGIGAGSGGRR